MIVVRHVLVGRIIIANPVNQTSSSTESLVVAAKLKVIVKRMNLETIPNWKVTAASAAMQVARLVMGQVHTTA
jgi:hypothetical protein